jgi:peroxiredoxin
VAGAAATLPSDGVTELPSDLPVPEDDGACDHLPGSPVPSIRFAATTGGTVDLGELARGTAVVYVYPATGRPGEPLPPGWDTIPGARGCTPQNCAFRDLYGEFRRLGVDVVGLSMQTAEEQAEFARREHIPYPLLSDPERHLSANLQLPVFEVGGRLYYRRVTLVLRDGKVARVFYPVFPPDRNAAEVLDWLRANPT